MSAVFEKCPLPWRQHGQFGNYIQAANQDVQTIARICKSNGKSRMNDDEVTREIVRRVNAYDDLVEALHTIVGHNNDTPNGFLEYTAECIESEFPGFADSMVDRSKKARAALEKHKAVKP